MDDETPIEEVLDAAFLGKDISDEERARTLAELTSNFIVSWGLLLRINSDRLKRLNLSEDVIKSLQSAIHSPFGAQHKSSNSNSTPSSNRRPEKNSMRSTSGAFSVSSEIPPGHYRPPIIFNHNQVEMDSSDESSTEDSLDELLATWGFPKEKKQPGEKKGSSKCPWIFSMMLQDRKRQQMKTAEPTDGPTNAEEEEDSEISEEEEKPAHSALVPQGHSFDIAGLSSEKLEDAKAQCPHFAFQKKALASTSVNDHH